MSRASREPAGHLNSAGTCSPAVDVVVINWNGRRYLTRCMDALAASTIPLRIQVVDNGSIDGSAELLRRRHPGVELVALDRNRGYSGGANAGLVRGSAPYAFLMNPDLLVEPDHMERLVDRLESDLCIGAAQGKLYHLDADTFTRGAPPPAAVLDSAGQRIRRTRMVVDRGQGEADEGQYDAEASVFSACGAGLFLRRAALLDLVPGGPWLDPAFFAYKEDIDLCWRLRLHGWDVRYVPTAVAHHVRAMPGGDRTAWRRLPFPARRHSWKNHYLLMVKNDRFKDILASLPHVLAWEAGRLGFALLRDPCVLGSCITLAGILPGAIRARRRHLAAARARGVDLAGWFGRDSVPLHPYQ